MKSFERWRVLRQLESRDPEARAGAVERLLAEGGGREAELLMPYLVHEDSGVREAAIRVLQGLGESAVEPVARELERGYEETRLAAVQVLGGIAAPAAEAALLARLDAEEDENVRTALVRALTSRGSAAARERVLIAAMRDPWPAVRRVATEALSRRTDPLAREVLWIQLGDADGPVRCLAAEAIAAAPEPDSPFEPLIELLEDEHPGARAAAARALLALGWEPEDETQAALLEQELRESSRRGDSEQ